MGVEGGCGSGRLRDRPDPDAAPEGGAGLPEPAAIRGVRADTVAASKGVGPGLSYVLKVSAARERVESESNDQDSSGEPPRKNRCGWKPRRESEETTL